MHRSAGLGHCPALKGELKQPFPGLQANWTSVMDYSAGAFFCSDLIINFHVGFIAT